MAGQQKHSSTPVSCSWLRILLPTAEMLSVIGMRSRGASQHSPGTSLAKERSSSLAAAACRSLLVTLNHYSGYFQDLLLFEPASPRSILLGWVAWSSQHNLSRMRAFVVVVVDVRYWYTGERKRQYGLGRQTACQIVACSADDLSITATQAFPVAIRFNGMVTRRACN